jgi:hypothetical protein
MATIQFTVDDTVATDALGEVKLRTKNALMTTELFLENFVKNLARRCRIRAVDIDTIIDTTGL